MMEREWRSLLAMYGQEVTLRLEGMEDRPLRAFLQPVLDQEREQRLPSPLGQAVRRTVSISRTCRHPRWRQGGAKWSGRTGPLRCSRPIWWGTATGGPCAAPGTGRQHERRTGKHPGTDGGLPERAGSSGVRRLARRGAPSSRRSTGRGVPPGDGQAGPAGFQHYLGERYDERTGLWQELYGRKAALTFGLDLYAPRGQGDVGIQTAFDQVVQAFAQAAPQGLAVQEVACGETVYDGQAQADEAAPPRWYAQAYLYAAAQPGGLFTDFELRGGIKP